MQPTRDLALHEAAAILANEGYSSLTLERVAKAVDVKTASLYHHFSSRDELIAEAMIKGGQAVAKDVNSALDAVPEGQPLRRLKTAVRAHFASMVAHAPYTFANLRNVDQIPRDLRDLVVPINRDIDRLWKQLFADAIDANVFPPDVNVQALKQLMLSAMTTTPVMIRSIENAGPVELAEQLVDLLHGAAMGWGTLSSGLIDVSIEGAVGHIELRNPPSSILSEELIQELSAAVETLTRSSARVVIVQSSTDQYFATGADLHALSELDAASYESYLLSLQAMLEHLAQAPFPTIAAIDGAAFGGGCELALACTFRIATAQARFAIPEIRFGLSLSGGTADRLVRLVGQQLALDVLLSGRSLDASEAHRVGLVDRIAADGLQEAAAAWAGEIATSSRASLAGAMRVVSSSNALQSGDDLRRTLAQY